MSWRVVVISYQAKLDYKLDYLVVRQESTTRIHLSEISTLIIETTAVSLTAALMCEMMKRKIKVIFCDERRNPNSELIPYYGSHDTSIKIRKQMSWTEDIKQNIWTQIVTEKIRQQQCFLEELGKPAGQLLKQYIREINYGDSTNREGHAAKVFFNAVFGMTFTRTADDPINSALNYGYGIILSAFNREIVANGYITQIGIFHDNMFNPFNLGSDLMEPFRILVDRKVYEMEPLKFDREEKLALINLLNQEVFIEGKRNYINNAIKIYCKSVLDALNENDISLMRFYRNEL